MIFTSYLKLRRSKIAVHLEKSIVHAQKNDFQCTDYVVLNLILKISGIEARNFSTKSFISCSEIVKTSLAVLMNNSIRRLKACTTKT